MYLTIYIYTDIYICVYIYVCVCEGFAVEGHRSPGTRRNRNYRAWGTQAMLLTFAIFLSLIWEFPKIRLEVPYCGVLITRILLYS